MACQWLAIVIIYNRAKAHGEKIMKDNQIEILRATPNNFETFNNLMLLGHTLHEKNNKNYSVIIDWKSDSVILVLDKESK